MTNRVKPIDISIISARMGRFQTLVVAVMVMSIAVHAFLTRDDTRAHRPLTILAPAGTSRFEPFARLVAQRTSRVAAVDAEAAESSAELFVLPALDFVQWRERLGLEGLFGMSAAAGDRAVIIAAPGHDGPPGHIDDLVFTARHSINGCWVQLDALDRDLDSSARADSLRFAPGGDPAYVVWAVQAGEVAYGACRASDLEGRVGEPNVVVEVPALPDWIVASRPADAAYFTESLNGLVASFARPSTAPDPVRLLGAQGLGGFRPFTPAQLAHLEDVFATVDRWTVARTAGGAGSP